MTTHHRQPDQPTVTDPLLWRLALDVAAAHQPDPNGNCHNLQCRHQHGPCQALRAATRALHAACRPATTPTPVPARRIVGRAPAVTGGFNPWPVLSHPTRPPTWPDRSAATATYPGRRAPCRLISAGKRNGWADPGTRAAGNPMAGGHPGLPPCWACRTPPPRRATCPSRGRSPPAAGGSGSCSSGDTSPNGTAAPDRGV